MIPERLSRSNPRARPKEDHSHAATAHERAAVVATFSSVWPAPAGRTRNGVAPRVVAHPSSRWSALLSQLAGTVGLLFEARAGKPFASTPGKVIRNQETLEVRMPMDAIDLDLRRAGLDRDPGWIPWLRQRVIITFIGPDDGTDEDGREARGA